MNIELSESEYHDLMALMDAAVRHDGLKAVKAVAAILVKVEASLKEQEDVIRARLNPDPEPANE